MPGQAIMAPLSKSVRHPRLDMAAGPKHMQEESIPKEKCRAPRLRRDRTRRTPGPLAPIQATPNT